MSIVDTLPKEVVDNNKEILQEFTDKYFKSNSALINAIHNKTGNTYFIIELVLNCTNSNDGQILVMYQRYGKHFVREIGEFMQKFSPGK